MIESRAPMVRGVELEGGGASRTTEQQRSHHDDDGDDAVGVCYYLRWTTYL